MPHRKSNSKNVYSAERRWTKGGPEAIKGKAMNLKTIEITPYDILWDSTKSYRRVQSNTLRDPPYKNGLVIYIFYNLVEFAINVLKESANEITKKQKRREKNKESNGK